MNRDLIERFCTPPLFPFTETEAKVIEDAERTTFPFEGRMLDGFCWGNGKTVLMVHGWGSRATHMGFLGRFLARSGYRVVAYDAPAHSSHGTPSSATSNMFEYCRAIHTVASSLDRLHAVVGHSFGAACTAFTTAEISAFAGLGIPASKLVLISPPPTLVDIYRSFCRKDIIGECGVPVLKETLERDFGFVSEDYTMDAALRKITADTLIVHDANDEEFPIADIRALIEPFPAVKLHVTEGSGHQRILVNRAMMAGVKDYLLES